ncbi:MAG TPA: SDR family oxidoreductase [Actinomycetota bacterium]|nr:SDR family oxidoreductase [Actinomycetota bacterium]
MTAEAVGQGAVVVVGGTSGIGKAIARHYVTRGREVVLTGRDPVRAKAVAEELGGRARGVGLDLTEVETIRPALADVGRVDHLVLTAVDRDENTVRGFDHARALRLVTLKLVGYTEVVHVLMDRMHEESSIVIFGGLAKDRPYPGSTTVSTVNGGVTGLVHSLAVELAPIRVNAIHPGIVGDTPYWSGKPESVLEGIRSRTPLQRLVRTEDVVHAVAFLLENRSMNGADLVIDGGWVLL